MLTPGTAFLLAYLPWRRTAHTARVALLDRNASTIDPALRHALDFSRQALKVEDSMVAETDKRHAGLAAKAGSPPQLTTPVLRAAWKAGELARDVSIAASLAAHLAYLRTAAAENADLRAQAADNARKLVDGAAKLKTQLEAMGLPLVASHANNVAKMISLTRNLEPTTTGGYKQLNELVRDVDNFIEAHARQLDAPPPSQASSPPTAEEEALLARILANPSDHRLRTQLADLGARRNDPRAELIRLQLSGNDSDRAQINNLVRAHPEWASRLSELGARDIKFSGGFPDEITIDGDVLLARGADLLAAAPLTRLHVRNAKGRVANIVRSPLLATIEALDLDDQGVTDDDVIALAASQHARRLHQLDLRYNPLTARGIEAIAASPHLKRLDVVALDGNPADPVDRVQYVDETSTQRVPTEAGKALEAKYGPLRWLHHS